MKKQKKTISKYENFYLENKEYYDSRDFAYGLEIIFYKSYVEFCLNNSFMSVSHLSELINRMNNFNNKEIEFSINVFEDYNNENLNLSKRLINSKLFLINKDHEIFNKTYLIRKIRANIVKDLNISNIVCEEYDDILDDIENLETRNEIMEFISQNCKN